MDNRIEEKAKEIAEYSKYLSDFPHHERSVEYGAVEMANWLLSHLWIPVEEKLPDPIENEHISDYVFVTNGTWSDAFRYDFSKQYWIDYLSNSHWGITHWMPIPEIHKR